MAQIDLGKAAARLFQFNRLGGKTVELGRTMIAFADIARLL